MACAGSFGVPVAVGCILCTCFRYLADLICRGFLYVLFWLRVWTCWGFSWALVSVSWTVWCVSGAVDRDFRLRLVLLSMILLFRDYGSMLESD